MNEDNSFILTEDELDELLKDMPRTGDNFNLTEKELDELLKDLPKILGELDNELESV